MRIFLLLPLLITTISVSLATIVAGDGVQVFGPNDAGVSCFRIPALAMTTVRISFFYIVLEHLGAEPTSCLALLYFPDPFLSHVHLQSTSQKGTLVAFAEARHGSCSDGAVHEIAVTRSSDGGKTWDKVGRSPLVPSPVPARTHLSCCLLNSSRLLL